MKLILIFVLVVLGLASLGYGYGLPARERKILQRSKRADQFTSTGNLGNVPVASRATTLDSSVSTGASASLASAPVGGALGAPMMRATGNLAEQVIGEATGLANAAFGTVEGILVPGQAHQNSFGAGSPLGGIADLAELGAAMQDLIASLSAHASGDKTGAMEKLNEAITRFSTVLAKMLKIDQAQAKSILSQAFEAHKTMISQATAQFQQITGGAANSLHDAFTALLRQTLSTVGGNP